MIRAGLGLAVCLSMLPLPAAAAAAESDLEIHPLETWPLPGARADVAALLLSGRDRGSLEALALALPSPPAAEAPGLDFWLEVAGAGLLGECEDPEGPETLRLELYAYAMTRAGELAGHLSRRVRIPAAELGEALRSGGVMLAGRLVLPPGEVQLHLLARELGSQRFALRVLRFTVPPRGSAAAGEAEAPPLPPELSPAAGEAWVVRRTMVETGAPAAAARPPAEVPEAPPGAGAARHVQAIAGRYLAVLDLLASGDTEAAVDVLVEVESAELASADDRVRARGWLADAEDAVIEELADGDVECLLPLLVLHIAAHDRYVDMEATDPFLPGEARRRILSLVRLYTAKASHDLGRTLAASALAELGIAIDRAGLPIAASRMLEEALALDGGHASALLYLGFWHERRGACEDAVPRFERLLEVAPRSHQGRLRLGLCLARLGNAEAASDHLQRLIHDGGPEWLLTIAYEELGRLLLAGGNAEEAARLLDAGVARLPSEQRLYVQLAYALDRDGRRRRAQDVLDRLPADAGHLSPRNLYSRRPQTGDERSRAALERHATARLPLLSAALEKAGGAR